MIAFFFTMPISRIDPDKRVQIQIVAEQQQREKRAKTRGWQTGQNRDRMNKALVQNA